MKNIKKYIIILLSFIILMTNSSALYADELLFSVSASKYKTTPNSKVTITIKLDGEGLFEMKATNAKLNVSSEWVNKSYSFEATVGKEGKAIITVDAVDVAGYDALPITGKKTIVIDVEEKKVVKPSVNNTDKNDTDSSSKDEQNKNESNKKPQQNTKPQEDKKPQNDEQTKQEETQNDTVVDQQLSNDNYLKTLEISTGTLTPAFNKDITTYKVSLTSDIQSVQISAKANNSLAKIEGTGHYDLTIGNQTKKVVCIAENGDIKVYTITFDVQEKPTAFITFNNQKLGIIVDTKDAKIPQDFVEGTLDLQGNKIKSWTHKTSRIQIVYLSNEKGDKNFYICKNNKIVSLYDSITINNKVYTLTSIPEELLEKRGFTFSKITINDRSLDGWTFNDETFKDYSLLYLINEKGQTNTYIYEHTEGTIQKYTPLNSQSYITQFIHVLVIACGVLLLSTIAFSYLYFHNKKVLLKKLKQARETIEEEKI